MSCDDYAAACWQLTRAALATSKAATVTGGVFAMSDDPDRARLEALEAKIKAAKGEEEAQRTGDAAYNQASFAWQMVIELVVGLLTGFGIGYGLDAVLGTAPWLMVLFIMLGFAAGVRVMLGTAKQMQEKQAEASARDEKDRTRGD